MPYRLLIDISVVNDPKYAPLLEPEEAVRGISVTLSFAVKNIGKDFPGGRVREIAHETATGGYRVLRGKTKVDIPIPKLKRQKDFTFNVTDFRFMAPGTTRVSIKVETEDKEEVEYLQVEKGETCKGQSVNFIYVTERNLLDLILLLKSAKRRRR